ncbi:hypothetical protein Bca4012_016751 [Brassica carinata]
MDLRVLKQRQIDNRVGMGLLGSMSGDSNRGIYGRKLHQPTLYCKENHDWISTLHGTNLGVFHTLLQ